MAGFAYPKDGNLLRDAVLIDIVRKNAKPCDIFYRGLRRHINVLLRVQRICVFVLESQCQLRLNKYTCVNIDSL